GAAHAKPKGLEFAAPASPAAARRSPDPPNGTRSLPFPTRDTVSGRPDRSRVVSERGEDPPARPVDDPVAAAAALAPRGGGDRGPSERRPAPAHPARHPGGRPDHESGRPHVARHHRPPADHPPPTDV